MSFEEDAPQFREWLVAGGRTKSAVATRLSRLRGLERGLVAMDAPQPTLEEAYRTDAFEGLLERLNAIKAGPSDQANGLAVLTGTSVPAKYIASLRSYLRLYRQFLDGEPSGPVASGEDGDGSIEGDGSVADPSRSAGPRNIILYGPPGTGKTFGTARRAVTLVDGRSWSGDEAPDDTEVLARYRELVATKQIEFVTFHQSYGYEDFIEGFRPVSRADVPQDAGSGSPVTLETGSSASSGLAFELKKGVFRSISARAEEARQAAANPKAARDETFSLDGRGVYKMSIGRAGSEDHMFDDAIGHGYAALGWGGDEDWSDERYRRYENVFERWNEIEPGTSGNSGNISQIWRFREMRKGDVIVVSQGNRFFRAIGIVTGDYRFQSDAGESYKHRRDVDWRVVPKEPIAVSEIYDRDFSQASCYRMNGGYLKRPALERLIAQGSPGGGTEADTVPSSAGERPNQFVLVIDEINRANVSKVFGELITLIEPDKRLGQENALTLTLPYSNEPFGVPDNLHIVGTMNTADRSIALLDTALRRRFEFRELMPDASLLPEDVDGVPLRSLLRTINARIEYLFDREHQIGHAFFIRCRTRADVDRAMRRKVLPLLAEYFYEDWSRIAAVLGDPDGKRFLERTALQPPPGLSDEGDARFGWRVRERFADDAYAAF